MFYISTPGEANEGRHQTQGGFWQMFSLDRWSKGGSGRLDVYMCVCVGE